MLQELAIYTCLHTFACVCVCRATVLDVRHFVMPASPVHSQLIPATILSVWFLEQGEPTCGRKWKRDWKVGGQQRRGKEDGHV